MARTPSRYAVAILDLLGPWAKPFAATGGLAALGGVLLAAALLRRRVAVGLGVAGFGAALCLGIEYQSWLGAVSFWVPAGLILAWGEDASRSGSTRQAKTPDSPSGTDSGDSDIGEEVSAGVPTRQARVPAPPRREFVLSAVMASGTVGVALESYLRNEILARRAVEPVVLHPFDLPVESGRFMPPLVRRAVTPVAEFYGMSKNTVDPVIDPRNWRLKITIDGRVLREISYRELLALPRTERYVTMRCISNTLQSNLMGTALWSGVGLSQVVDRRALPQEIVEAAVIGVDGHGDSYPLDYLFSDSAMLAIGMNGRTLNRTHGFPVRLLVPRYYGFKNVKWIGEIRFLTKPYFGTWPKMGYTKEALIHTCSSIDTAKKMAEGILVGGVSFAGERGIRRVQLRAEGSDWVDCELERTLSAFTWTRWRGLIPLVVAATVEARAQDGFGDWQASREHPLFPSGVSGPTIRRITL